MTSRVWGKSRADVKMSKTSSEMQTMKKKVRKVNWTPSELECLVDEVEKHKSILFSSFTSTITNSKKKRIWNEISFRVSACGSSSRSSEDCKKKWTTLKSDTRKKAGHHKKVMSQTGGGPPPSPLNEIEYKVVSLIPSVQIEGCPGGLDSEDLSGLGTALCGDTGCEAVPSTSNCNSNLHNDIDSALISPLLHFSTPLSSPPASCHFSPDIVSRTVSKRKRSKVQAHEDSRLHAAEVVQLEREKVAIMQEKLQIDRERLQVEKDILTELRMMREQTHDSMNPICMSPIIKF